jgi:serine/threonine protein kinase
VLPSDTPYELGPEFEFIRPLGEGTVAHVVLARETELKRLVAIKIPRREIAQDETARRRFEREALSAARLTHPNIVSVFRVGHLPDGTPYLVMRYVEGRTLEDVLRSEGSLSEPEARAILLQLASALAEAHGKGIIHRDLRPANVVWTRESGQAVLMDFGLAAIVESGSEAHARLTQTGQRLGDFEHMSPEQFRDEPITPATDLYSLGVLGYEVLTGSGPYRVTSKAQLAFAHLNDAPRWLPHVSPELAQLLEACLAKKPVHRPAAADVMRRLSRPELVDAASAGPVHSIPALSAFVKELKRRRVFNVALLYAGGAFILLQVAELILPSLPLPVWSYDAVVAATLAGFPIALVVTWIFEITGGRVLRTETSALQSPRARRTQLVLQAAGLAASLLLAGLIGWWVLGS